MGSTAPFRLITRFTVCFDFFRFTTKKEGFDNYLSLCSLIIGSIGHMGSIRSLF